MYFEDTMYNWDVTTLYFEDNYLPYPNWFFFVVGKKEKVSPVKCWLHATTGNTIT